MEVMLQGLEERIISKLSVRSSVDRALLEKHDTTIQQLETSMNDMKSRVMELDTTCNMLIQEVEMLRLKLMTWKIGRRNNICITGLPEKAEGP